MFKRLLHFQVYHTKLNCFFLCFIIIIKTQNMPKYVEATVIDVVDDIITDPDTVVVDIKEEITTNNNFDFYVSDSGCDSDIEVYSFDTDYFSESASDSDIESDIENDNGNMTEEEIDEFEKFIENKMICCIALISVGLIAAVFVYTRSKY